MPIKLDTPAQVRHAELLLRSYRHWTGLDLAAPDLSPEEASRWLFDAPFAVVSHGTEGEPIFNYGNRLALKLFEMNWQEFTALPSHLSAEPVNQAEREALLRTVTQKGFISDYSGIRIAKSGRRFRIGNATVWNLLDEQGEHAGQAALIRSWQDLGPF